MYAFICVCVYERVMEHMGSEECFFCKKISIPTPPHIVDDAVVCVCVCF